MLGLIAIEWSMAAFWGAISVGMYTDHAPTAAWTLFAGIAALALISPLLVWAADHF